MRKVLTLMLILSVLLIGCALLSSRTPSALEPLAPLTPTPSASEPDAPSQTGPLEAEGEVMEPGAETDVEWEEQAVLEEEWQTQVRRHYLEAWAYLYQETPPDPARVEYYFQDVSWPGDDLFLHQRTVVESMRIVVTNLAGVEWKDIHEVSRRKVTVGPLSSAEEEELVEVVDYVLESVIHLTNVNTGEVIEGDVPVSSHVNRALLVYDEGDGRWKIGGFRQIILPKDPEEAEQKYQEMLEETERWQ